MMAGNARTDGDSWDITTSVGFTALLVAAARAVETSRPDALARDPYARDFIEAAGEPRALALLDVDQPDHPLASNRHLGLRTKFFDEAVLAATTAGIRQIVILASGLDTRAYRLDLPPETAVFELDQPAVLEFKSRTLAANGVQPAAQLRTIAVDLREDWPTALRSAGFDEGAPAIWLAEGLLPYLPSDAQTLLFERIVALSAPGSRVAVEGLDGEFDLAEVRRLMAEYSSPDSPLADFDVTALFVDEGQTRPNPTEFFAAQGWSIQRAGGPIELGKQNGIDATEESEEVAGLSGAIVYFTAQRPG